MSNFIIIEMEQFSFRFLLISMMLLGSVVPLCLDYGDGGCVLCDQNSRLVGGKCYENVRRCIEYERQQLCVLCEGNMTPNEHGQCPDTQKSRMLYPINMEDQMTLYTLAYGSSSLTINYLDPRESKKDPLFVLCDSFIRKGEYGHFISKTCSPWQSISFQLRGRYKKFRIIYLAVGGGVMLCIIQIDTVSLAIILKSLVQIVGKQIVNNCLDYAEDRKCVKCKQNYHLYENSCIGNIGGCISYFGNICLECKGWGLLVQNRCVYDCSEECDTARMSYWSKQIRY